MDRHHRTDGPLGADRPISVRCASQFKLFGPCLEVQQRIRAMATTITHLSVPVTPSTRPTPSDSWESDEPTSSFSTGEPCTWVANSRSSVSTRPAHPTPPLIGSAAAGPAQATLASTSPMPDGRPPVTSSALTALDSTNSAIGIGTVSRTERPITVSGSAGGDTSTCTSTVTNAVGAGPPSSLSNLVPPAWLREVHGRAVRFDRLPKPYVDGTNSGSDSKNWRTRASIPTA